MHPKITHRFHKKDVLLKYQQHQENIHTLQKSARQEATRLAHLLIDKFAVRAVYLIGPLTYEQYQEGMPLELAAEGLSKDVYGIALAHLRHSSTYDIELIDLAQADSWTIRSVREKGLMFASSL